MTRTLLHHPLKIRPAMILVCLSLWIPALRTWAAPASRPNIVLIFADDLGWKDVGYNGTDFYETPNIDRLAAQGMIFDDAYAAGGNCQPSRACLLSGQYTPRHGVYAVSSTRRGPENLMRLIPIPNTTHLRPEQVTIAEVLKASGYATACIGKWHVGNDRTPGTMPAEQGFDFVLDQNHPGSGAREDPKGIYTMTRAACDFMETHAGTPFFLYMSHHAIHTGLQGRQASVDRFTAKPKGKQHDEALYAACTYDLDDGVGILLRKLTELGLETNTLVVFTSDNGGTQQSSQEPLRGNKGCYYEGGIREPFIARWPGVIPPGARCRVPIINVDLYPTFLEVAGAPVPPGKVLDGESLVPLFKGAPRLQREAIFWHFPGYLDNPVLRGRDPVFRSRPVSVIRKGDWKLHLYHEEWQLDGGMEQRDSNNSIELYNLRADVGERENLAGSQPAKRDELLGTLLRWQGNIGALMPTERNPAHDPDSPVQVRRNRRQAGQESEE